MKVYYHITPLVLLMISILTNSSPAAWPATAATPTGDYTLYLPVIFRPEVLTPSPEVILQITPEGWYTVSTYEPGSFRLTNAAANEQNIMAVTIDLRTAVFPDMVFDPYGLAGDLVAKNLAIDSNGLLTGFAGHSFASPHDGGYDVLQLFFTDFNPGETMTFSIDVDPTSIRGSDPPGPSESGSVSGLELTGSTVLVNFADNTALIGHTFRIPGSVSGSQAVIRAALPEAPTIQAEGIAGSTAVVTHTQQTINIQTAPARHIKLLVIEGGLFTAGVPGGGYDLDPFEANTALLVGQYEGQANDSGQLSLPIQLWRTQANGGLNIIVAVPENSFGYLGTPSTPIILHLQD